MEAKQNFMSQYVLTREDAKDAFAVEYFMVLLDEFVLKTPSQQNLCMKTM